MFKYHFNIGDFVIERFFSYTTTIQCDCVIAEVNMNKYRYYPNICQKFDDFYNQLANEATKLANDAAGAVNYYNYFFKDNKTVFQIRHKYSGRVFFIGKYDYRRAIGTGCHLFDGRIYDFKTHKITDYVSDVRADARGMWKKFEL